MRNGSPRFVTLALLITLLATTQAFALTRHVDRPHKVRHFRGILWNPLFKPTHDSLVRQNDEVNRLELPRIANSDQLEELKASAELVPIVPTPYLRIEPHLDPARRYCRSWTRNFLDDLSRAYYLRFNDQIQVNSAVRTVTVQRRLRRHNRNAAPESGALASSHLAGLTVDLQRRGMTTPEIRFVEQYLFYLHALGLVEPEEEKRQWVFHVMVSDKYDEWRQTQTLIRSEVATETAAVDDATR